jgi:flagellin-like hook-associated protein FlgL
MQRLSTGLRINSARDDAAGLAISQSMTSQIRGLNQAVRNINDGVNLLQTAEGGLSSITDMLQRMRELAVQSANGTYSGSQRAYLQKEAAALQEQIGKVVDTTTWNDKKLLDGSFTGQKIQVGADSGATMDLTIPTTIGSSVQTITNTVTTTSLVDPAPIWTKQLATSGPDGARSVKIGADGSIYLTGYVSGAVDGENPLGGMDAFLSKYAADGTKLWTRLMGTAGNDFANDISLGSNGSVCVTGYANGSIAGSSGSAFIKNYAADGTLLWSRDIVVSSLDGGSSVANAPDGGIFVGGITSGNINGQQNNGQTDGFLEKYSADGTLLWARTLGSTNNDNVHAIASDASGNVYATGWATGSLDGQNDNGGGDAFLTKYDGVGNRLWTQVLGSSGTDYGNAVTIGVDGSVYIGGRAGGSMEGQPYGGGSADLFVSKFAANGTKLWTKMLGGSANEEVLSMVATSDGSVYITGNNDGNLDGQTNNGSKNIFIAKFGSDGTKAWTRLEGTSNADAVYRLAVGSDGALFLAGGTFGSFNGQVILTGGDATLTKYSAPSLSTITTTTTSQVNVAALSVDISTQAGASSAIGVIDSTLDSVNSARSTIGSYINRLNYAADNATNISTNIAASRSAIQDTDYAEESANLAKSQIIQQAATAMLAQANQQPQSVLALLKNL